MAVLKADAAERLPPGLAGPGLVPSNEAMHELSIAEAILQQVDEVVRQSGQAGRVTRVELSIGVLSGVCVDSVRFALGLLTEGTELAQTEFRIRQPGAECVCGECGQRTPIDDLVMACPQCGSSEIAIQGGRDLLLESVELEEGRR